MRKFYPEFGRVIDHVPIPELHEVLGITNKIYDELILRFPAAKSWPEKLCLVRAEYHHSYEVWCLFIYYYNNNLFVNQL